MFAQEITLFCFPPGNVNVDVLNHCFQASGLDPLKHEISSMGHDQHI